MTNWLVCRQELGILWAQLRAITFPVSTWFFGPHLMNFALVVSHAGSGGTFPASALFMALALDSIVAEKCLGIFFESIRRMAEASVALSRIQVNV